MHRYVWDRSHHWVTSYPMPILLNTHQPVGFDRTVESVVVIGDVTITAVVIVLFALHHHWDLNLVIVKFLLTIHTLFTLIAAKNE